jgi:hypothetical protein
MSANKTKSEFLNGKYLNYFENSLPYPTYIVAFSTYYDLIIE